VSDAAILSTPHVKLLEGEKAGSAHFCLCLFAFDGGTNKMETKKGHVQVGKHVRTVRLWTRCSLVLAPFVSSSTLVYLRTLGKNACAPVCIGRSFAVFVVLSNLIYTSIFIITVLFIFVFQHCVPSFL
jgi:hypothetical protein